MNNIGEEKWHKYYMLFTHEKPQHLKVTQKIEMEKYKEMYVGIRLHFVRIGHMTSPNMCL